MRRKVGWTLARVWVATLSFSSVATAQLALHDTVVGVEVQEVRLERDMPNFPYKTVNWASLSTTVFPPKKDVVLFISTEQGAGPALEVPYCALMENVGIDDKVTLAPSRPVVVDLPANDKAHGVRLRMKTSVYEPRVACSNAPRFGTRERTLEGLDEFSFPSAHPRDGGGKAVVFIPKGHDMKRPSALLVGLHPWNGGIWTYAAYEELLHEANAKDVVLLMRETSLCGSSTGRRIGRPPLPKAKCSPKR